MCTEVQGEASVSGSKALQLDVVCLSQCWDLSLSFFLSFSISLLFFFLCHVFLPSYQSSLCLPLVILSFFFALLCPSVNLSLSLSVFLHLFLFIFSIHPSTSSTVLPSSLLSFVLDFLLSLPPSYQSICLCQFLPSFNSSFLSSLFTLF